MLNYKLLYIAAALVLSSCMKGKDADLVIHNAQIHTMVDGEEVQEAIAIKDGKILEVGPERQILNKYSAEEYVDAQMRDIYPGFTDAHGHLFGYARQRTIVDLTGCKSYDELIVRLEKYQSKHNRKILVGRGWDQSLWGEKELPTNKQLSKTFPNTPVCLSRVDGHALLANDKMLELSNVLEEFNNNPDKYGGGQVLVDELGKPTGIVVDNAMGIVYNLIPSVSDEEMSQLLIDVQQDFYAYGITGIHEAGMTRANAEVLEDLINNGKFHMNIYGMLYPDEANLDWARKNGVYVNKNLLIRSFKVMGDGALGSRGAFLKKPYSDREGHHGHMTISIEELKEIAETAEKIGYQMNTHAIGDSTNRVLLDLCKGIYKKNPDHRWRIEHAQVVDSKDFKLFSEAGVFPSVQPTHAISDQRWAEQRLGKERLVGAYAYKSLLNQFGMLAIGTDFPVEDINPFRTIHAAVNRKTLDNFPSNGFLMEEAITLDECLKGMTIWAAFAAFQEDELGTLEKGKDATLVIFERPVSADEPFEQNFARTTFIKGKKVYSVE